MQDHPRLCGEKRQSNRKLEIPTGSPPPMRGKGKSKIQDRFVFRITPAYAGKSVGIVQPLSVKLGSPPPMRGKADITIPADAPVQDHPRLCGEKVTDEGNIVTGEGSPPPMRGKARKSAAAALSGRITPAYAGKRYTPWHLWNRYKDHPRLCGEKFSFLRQPMRLPGSPPPMRGKDISNFRILILSRITPAYAGKSKL